MSLSIATGATPGMSDIVALSAIFLSPFLARVPVKLILAS